MAFKAAFRSRVALRGVAAASVTVVGATYLLSPVALADEPPKSPDKRPPALWTPPSRQDMLDALKDSRPLPAEISDPSSANFSGLQAKNVKGKGKEAESEEGYDLLIIGAGATGAGCALDAASRGLKTALVERDDFCAGSSSKSTKLVHGGVRYLQAAILGLDIEQWNLVREALKERKLFLHTAPYLSHPLPIMLPVYSWIKLPYYWIGTKLYDALAGGENLTKSYFMSKSRTLEHFPLLKTDSLVGSLVYYDGQHNDARMGQALVMTAIHHGAVVANYVEAVKLYKNGPNNQVSGARLRDKLTGNEWDVKTKGVINATGPFCDGVRKLDDPSVKEIVAPSSGVHVTLPRYYSPGKMGLIDPNTSDGRVIFFLPWEGNAIAGTTDTAEDSVPMHPKPREEEVEWILGEVRNYLSPEIKVRRGDVLSAWSGIRPLVRNPNAKNSQSLVRSHMIDISPSGLLTISGGKWTTYRNMAKETIDAAVKHFNLSPDRDCQTAEIRLFGSHGWYPNIAVKLIQQYGLATDVANHLCKTYGDQAWAVCALADPTGQRWPIHGRRLDNSYPYIEAEVRYACRREYACTATDIIARRTRLSFLNSQAALDVLPGVIDLMSVELGWKEDEQERQFNAARDFLTQSMGLPISKSKLSLADVREGKARGAEVDDPSTSRAIFQSEELEHLRNVFAKLDADGDSQISEQDLTAALKQSGFGQVPKQTVKAMVRDAARTKDGTISFNDFLDVAGSMKEVSLSNAFSNVIKSFDDSQDPEKTEVGPKSSGAGQTDRRRISTERSGGGT